MLKKLLSLVVLVLLFSPRNANATHAVGADLTYECLGNNRYKVVFTFYRDCAGNTGAFPTETTNSIALRIWPAAKCTTGSCDTVVTPITDTVFNAGAPGCTYNVNINPCVPAVPLVDLTTTQLSTFNSTTITWNHTVSGTNRLLIVQVFSNDDAPTGCTYAGQAMAQIGSSTNGTRRMIMYRLVAPPLGANPVVVTFTNPAGAVDNKHAAAISFTGVNQGGQNGTSVSSGNPCPAKRLVTANANDLILDFMGTAYWYGNATALAGQTSLYSLVVGNYSAIGGSVRPGTAGQDSMQWDWDNFYCANAWSMFTLVLNPVSCSGANDTDTVWAAQCYVIDTIGWDTTYQNCGAPAPFTVTLTKPLGTGQEVTPICPSSRSTCSGGTINGIREFRFEGIVDFTNRGVCDDWRLNYAVWARNNAITTVQTPGSDSLYIESHINPTLTPCNSSPIFSNKPVPFVCVGQKFCFNQGAIDFDGDSLAYKFFTPKAGPNLNVVYNPPYTTTQPLRSTPPATLDPLSGDICVTPTQTDVTILAIMVDEYRNGVWIGSVVRDMQMNIINCNNQLPYTNGINNTGKFDTTICAGNTLCFDIPSFDADAPQNVTMDWNQGIPGATFTVGAGPKPTAQFCWTPSAAEVSPIAYCFTVEVKDDNCPLNGFQSYAYCITVGGAYVDLGPDTAACSANSIQLDAGPGFTYLWSTGSTNQTVNVNASGKYWVQVSGGGCTVSDTINVGVGYPFVNLGPDQGICGGDSVTLVAGVPPTPYNFTWSTGASTPSIRVGTTGQYWVVVDSAGTCSRSDTVDLVINPNPVLNTNADTLVCSGDSIQLNVTGATTYLWSPVNFLTSDTISNPIAFPPVSMPFIVVGYNGAGCSDTDTVMVTVDSTIAILNNDTIICPGDSVQLIVSGGGTYTWTPSFNLSCSTCPNPWAKPDTTTIYNVVAQYVSGCQAEAKLKVEVQPKVVINAAPDSALCVGDSVQLNASGGGTYLWSPPAGLNNPNISNPIATPTGTSVYIVEVTDPNTACKNKDTITIVIDTLPGANITGAPELCNGDSVVLNASPGGFTYLWNTGSTADSISVNPIDTITYTVTITNGACKSIDSITVNVTPIPTADISGTGTICSIDSVLLTATPSGGQYTYNWSTGPTTPSITVTPGTTTTYTVTVSQGSCSATDTFTVNVTQQPVANLNGNTTNICAGSSATLTATPAPGPYTYSWSPSGGPLDISIVNPTSTTIYTVTISEGSCSDTAQFTVNVTPLPVANVTGSNDSLCAGGSVTLTATPGGGAYTYTWLAPGSGTTPQIVVSPTGSGTYTVIVSEGICSDTASFNINVVPIPAVNLTGDKNNICSGGSATLTATPSGGQYTYDWSPPNSGPVIVVSPTAPTTYTVTVTEWLCPATATYLVSVTTQPIASINGNGGPVCSGDAVTLTANPPGYTYVWTPSGSGSTQTIVVTPSGTITYTVSVVNGICSDDTFFTVNVNQPPTAYLSGPDSVCQIRDGVITFTGSGTNLVWDWDGATLVSGTAPGPYTIKWDKPAVGLKKIKVISSVPACPDATDSVVVDVKVCDPLPPNIMTPNNPNFYVRDLDKFPNTRVVIYNRWGLKIYESNNYKNNWDGTTMSGLKVPDGVYYYIASYFDGTSDYGFLHIFENRE